MSAARTLRGLLLAGLGLVVRNLLFLRFECFKHGFKRTGLDNPARICRPSCSGATAVERRALQLVRYVQLIAFRCRGHCHVHKRRRVGRLFPSTSTSSSSSCVRTHSFGFPRMVQALEFVGQEPLSLDQIGLTVSERLGLWQLHGRIQRRAFFRLATTTTPKKQCIKHTP